MQQTFGEKQGIKLFLAARGLDDRPLKLLQARKSVSVELSFGVRFDTIDQVFRFIEDISKELQRRAKAAGLKGKTIVLNVMQRHPEAKPTTFLGHGWCITHSKGQTLPEYTDSPEVFRSVAMKVFRVMNVPPSEVRGVGIHLSNLTNSKNVGVGMTSLDKMVVRLNAPAYAPVAPAAAAPVLIRDERAPQAPSRRPIGHHGEADEDEDDEEGNDADDELIALDTDALHAVPPALQVPLVVDVEKEPSQDVAAVENVSPLVISPEADYQTRLAIKSLLHEGVEFGSPSTTILEILYQFGAALVHSRNLEEAGWLLATLSEAAKSHASWTVPLHRVVRSIQGLVVSKYQCSLRVVPS